MADGTPPRQDETPGRETAALRLLEMVAAVEGVALSRGGARDRKAATRQWILETYTECLKATETK